MPKKTLGEYLKDQASIGDTPTSHEGDTDASIATDLYAAGFPSQDISEATPGSPIPTTPAEGSSQPPSPLDAESDLSLDARQILAGYAHANLSVNQNYPRETLGTATGHKRLSSWAPTTDGDDDGGRVHLDAFIGSEPDDGLVDGPLRAHFDKTSFFPPDQLTNILTKQGVSPADESRKNPNTLLRDIKGFPDDQGGTHFGTVQDTLKKVEVPASDSEGGSDTIGFYTQQILESLNRFTPSEKTPFLSPTGDDIGEARLTKGLYTLQSGKMGSYDKDANQVTVADLRRAALEILHKAQNYSSDDAQSVADAISKEGDVFNQTAELMYLTPHGTQMGFSTVAVDNLKLRHTMAVDALGFDPKGAESLLDTDSFSTTLGGGGDLREISNGDSKALTLLTRSRNAYTYGTMNSPTEQFGGITPWGMIWPTIFSLIGLFLFGLLIGAFMSGFGTTKSPVIDAENPSSYAFGSNSVYGTDIGQMFLQLFGIPRTGGASWLAVSRGVMIFYGLDKPAGPLFIPDIDALFNILLAPGYYAVVSKRILQDFEQINTAFSAIGGASIPQGALTTLLGAVEALASSFTLRFFFIMASIGHQAEKEKVSPGGIAHAGANVIPLTKQRSEGKLWAGNRNSLSRWHVPGESRVVSPLSMFLHNSVLLSTEGNQYIPEGSKAGIVTIAGVDKMAGPRISAARVKQVEDLIDAEYMPFSLHDLRTNEVISLPAFINSVSDDFNSEYASSHGFGRTDPVMSYNKTTRSIALNFSLVAQSADDHEYMWYVVNKIVSMVYPQRDAGRKRYNPEDGKPFIQPFSQTISASPVIRIRLGDTIHSNSSNHAMRQIFGGQAVLTQAAPTGTGALSEESKKARTHFVFLRDQMRKIAAAYLQIQKLKAWGALATNKDADEDHTQFGALLLNKGHSCAVEIDSKFYPFTTQYRREVAINGLEKSSEPAKEVKDPGDDGTSTLIQKGVFVGEFSLQDEVDAYAYGGHALLSAYRASTKSVFPPPPIGDAPTLKIFVRGDGKNKPTFLTGTTAEDLDALWKENSEGFAAFYAMKLVNNGEADVNPSPSFYDDIMKTIDDTGGEGRDVDEINEFLSPKNNSFVRAISTASGRGLAGVITSLSLDYGNNTWGTTFDEGSYSKSLRAPKKVDINISFSPMHDFPLGLNHMGEMFAPSHPVGGLSYLTLGNNLEEVGTPSELGAANPQRLADIKEQAMRAVSTLPDTDDPAEPSLPF